MEGLTVVSGFRQKEVVVEGVTYTIQKMPLKAYLEMEDRNTSSRGVLLKAGYMADMLKHCVIRPKNVTLANFDDDFTAASQLVDEIERFHKSKPEQPKTEQDPDPEEGER